MTGTPKTTNQILRDTRAQRLLPNGIPRYIRCYDNGGETFDRFTVIFTGRYAGRDGSTQYRGMSEHPCHPQGFGQWGESRDPIDRPAYGHLGKRIRFADLSTDCRRLVLRDYCDLWNLDRAILATAGEVKP